MKYSKDLCDRYIDALLQEIHLVGSQHHGKIRNDQPIFRRRHAGACSAGLKEIIDAISMRISSSPEGIGIELHPDDLTPSVLTTLKTAGVTKISIGIQSFQEKFQHILGRSPINAAAIKKILSEIPFETVSMDFIFALPNQTFDDLKADLDAAFQNGANHIAVYPFIDFTFTSSPLEAMPKKQKRVLLDAITQYCMECGYFRTSIWTFSSQKNAQYSSMTRENFLGFGCSATTLLKEQFKINTFSVDAYCRRIAEESFQLH